MKFIIYFYVCLLRSPSCLMSMKYIFFVYILCDKRASAGSGMVLCSAERVRPISTVTRDHVTVPRYST